MCYCSLHHAELLSHVLLQSPPCSVIVTLLLQSPISTLRCYCLFVMCFCTCSLQDLVLLLCALLQFPSRDIWYRCVQCLHRIQNHDARLPGVLLHSAHCDVVCMSLVYVTLCFRSNRVLLVEHSSPAFAQVLLRSPLLHRCQGRIQGGGFLGPKPLADRKTSPSAAEGG